MRARRATRWRERADGPAIGADIADCSGAEGEELAVLVERQLDGRGLVAAMGIGGKALIAFGNPLDRAAKLLRRVEQQGWFGVAGVLGAEPATHIGRHMVQIFVRYFQNIGKRATVGVNILRGVLQEVFAGLRVITGYGAARFNGHCRHALVAQLQRDHMVGVFKCLVSALLVAKLEIEAEITLDLFPDLRSAGLQRFYLIGNRIEFPVIDLDHFGGVLRLAFSFGNDEGNRLSHVTHLVNCYGVARRLVQGCPVDFFIYRGLGGHGLEVFPHPVLARDDTQYAGHGFSFACFKRKNFGVSVGRAQNHRVGQVFRGNVVDIVAFAGEETSVFLAANGLSNSIFLHLLLPLSRLATRRAWPAHRSGWRDTPPTHANRSSARLLKWRSPPAP